MFVLAMPEAHKSETLTQSRKRKRPRCSITHERPSKSRMKRLAVGKAGQIHLGMKVDDFYTLCGRDNVQLIDLQNEGMFSPALALRLGPGSTSSLTAEGIHVSSTFPR